MSVYSIVEAASILKEKGVIKNSKNVNPYIIDNSPTTEDISQVVEWIKEYEKVYQQAYRTAVTNGDDYPEALSYAEKKASYAGIKAVFSNDEDSQQISLESLNTFIELRIGNPKEKELLDELHKFKMSKQLKIQKSNGSFESHWYDKGFEDAVAYLERVLLKNQQLQTEANTENVISFPKDYCCLDEKKIYALDFKLWNTEDSDILLIEFANQEITQIKFKMSVYKPKNGNEAETNIEWFVENGVLSINNQRDIEDFVLNKRNIRAIKRILQNQVPETEENKSEILNMFIS
ncbi:hypothetical protein U8V72_15280 [Priestia filamentosa]|uniref:hypothetical protein n=1 Tax=Priestia filamentosa TaxID=1402861 RepID=UPI0005896397